MQIAAPTTEHLRQELEKLKLTTEPFQSILLIYQMIPETLAIFRWDNPDEATTRLLVSAHGCIINNNADKYPPEVHELLNDTCITHRDHLVFLDNDLGDIKAFMPQLRVDDCKIIVAGFAL